jgi:hypothetical protein
MAEPDCFSCLEKEEEAALRSYMEQELHQFPSGVPFCTVRCRARPRHALTGCVFCCRYGAAGGDR